MQTAVGFLTVGVSKVAAMIREATCCWPTDRLTRAFFGVLLK
jgi:hypothetical protein